MLRDERLEMGPAITARGGGAGAVSTPHRLYMKNRMNKEDFLQLNARKLSRRRHYTSPCCFVAPLLRAHTHARTCVGDRGAMERWYVTSSVEYRWPMIKNQQTKAKRAEACWRHLTSGTRHIKDEVNLK